MKRAVYNWFLNPTTSSFPDGVLVKAIAQGMRHYGETGVTVKNPFTYPLAKDTVAVLWDDKKTTRASLYELALHPSEMAPAPVRPFATGGTLPKGNFGLVGEKPSETTISFRNKHIVLDIDLQNVAGFENAVQAARRRMEKRIEDMIFFGTAPRSKQPQVDARDYVSKLTPPPNGDALDLNARSSHTKVVKLADEPQCEGPKYDPSLTLDQAKETYATATAPDGSRPGDTGSARKMDAGKAPIMQGFDRYFANARTAVAMVSEYGDRKYAIHPNHYTTQWQEVPDGLNRYGDACERHGNMRHIEGEYDVKDSGLSHLAQKAWNAMAELELAIRTGKVEIMRGNEIKDGKPILGTASKA